MYFSQTKKFLGFQQQCLNFIEKFNLPFVTLLQSKGILDETHKNYLGLYEGRMGEDSVREFVESSDCIIMLGVFLTDMDLGHFTAKIDQKRTIFVQKHRTCVGYHDYSDTGLLNFFNFMSNQKIVSFQCKETWPKVKTISKFEPIKKSKLTTKR